MYLNPMRCLGNYIDSKPDSEQYYQHLTCISLSGEGKKRKLIILICSKKWFAVRALGSVETLTVLLTKVHWVKAMFFLVVMYACESWTIKKAECWRIDAFELWCWRRLLRVPWTSRRSNQSILKKSVLNIHWKDWCWSWSPTIPWPPDVKNWLIRKVPDAGKDWRHEEEGTTEDEMVGWHHWLNEHEFEQAPGDSEEQGSLVWYSPRGQKESDTTERLNWIELILTLTAPIILNWESWYLELKATKILKLQRQIFLCSLFYIYYGRKITQRMFNILQQERKEDMGFVLFFGFS